MIIIIIIITFFFLFRLIKAGGEDYVKVNMDYFLQIMLKLFNKIYFVTITIYK